MPGMGTQEPRPPEAIDAERDFASVPYAPARRSPDEVVRRGKAFYEELDRRRSVRMFSPDPVPREAIDYAIRAASTAPSGAHQQPWTWVVIGDTDLKAKIRAAAEREERTTQSSARSGSPALGLGVELAPRKPECFVGGQLASIFGPRAQAAAVGEELDSAQFDPFSIAERCTRLF